MGRSSRERLHKSPRRHSGAAGSTVFTGRHESQAASHFPARAIAATLALTARSRTRFAVQSFEVDVDQSSTRPAAARGSRRGTAAARTGHAPRPRPRRRSASGRRCGRTWGCRASARSRYPPAYPTASSQTAVIDASRVYSTAGDWRAQSRRTGASRSSNTCIAICSASRTRGSRSSVCSRTNSSSCFSAVEFDLQRQHVLRAVAASAEHQRGRHRSDSSCLVDLHLSSCTRERRAWDILRASRHWMARPNNR